MSIMEIVVIFVFFCGEILGRSALYSAFSPVMTFQPTISKYCNYMCESANAFL